MRVTVGTFNLNNLFSRYNFKGEVAAIRDDDTAVRSEVVYRFTGDDVYRLRSFMGRLVEAKDPAESALVAARVKAMDLDVLAVQEVEDIDTLKTFNYQSLDGRYRYYALVEGNDPRMIDVGVLSKYPLGRVVSWHQAVHPERPDEPVFSRDLLEVDILSESRTRRLFTLYNTHLKSHYVAFGDDAAEGARQNDTRRRRQAEAIRTIIEAQTRPDSSYLLVGDMNDPPDSPCLAAFAAVDGQGLANGLAAPQETRPAKDDDPPPASPAWTHRFKPAGQPAEYRLYDQIWLSRALAPRQSGAFIDRRTRHGGDGSDHDPAWIELDL